ncbi:uncharacterized protein LODBEIA_P03870 [Lodderomyces beijingensis]|uniref:Phospholipid/glycerol acyltransferase domain-containing protein n=1 Tax=Lodderomyces beijingensis TaxID=1775926 RepID=A0ABP0ZDC0_9ASCO
MSNHTNNRGLSPTTSSSRFISDESSTTTKHDYRKSKYHDKPIRYYVVLVFRILAYDLILGFFDLIIHTFFRDVQTRGSFNIPRRGPVIFVVAPHHNQFVDGLVVMTKVKQHSNRRIAFLIAQKSYDRFFIGHGAKLCSAIPVRRAQDLLKKGTGIIFGDESGDERVIRGKGTKFTSECEAKGLIGLPNSLGNCQILEIVNDEKIILKKPFSSPRQEIQARIQDKLQHGTRFKIAPHIDNHVVFQNVFDHLNDGKVLGIFPEGGSHDRPDLLPLKPGVAIMALGAVAQQMKERDEEIANGEPVPEAVTPVAIVPVGLNYFHPHKFRSRVVIEFGKPIVVDEKMAHRYKDGSRDAVDHLLRIVSFGLREVTMTCNDYETLMVLQAARRLYTSGNRQNIPLPMVIEMNRRLIKGYENHKDKPDVKELKEAVLEYNKKLRSLDLRDHQVESLVTSDRLHTVVTFLSRFFKFCLFMGLSTPGIVMFSPIFIISSKISKKKAREALAASTVKIKAKDVLSTWKILVALGLAPMLYIFWSVIGVVVIVKTQILGTWQPPIWIMFVVFYLWAVLTTYASLRMGEIGVDYYKSLKPLFISMISISSDHLQIEELKKTRRELKARVHSFCDHYGPGIFEDYDQFYRQYNEGEEDDFYEKEMAAAAKSPQQQRLLDLQRSTSASSLDFNIQNLADIPIFASADLEQANDVNLTKSEDEMAKEEEEEEEEQQRKQTEASGEVEQVDGKSGPVTSQDGPKMRRRKEMQEEYENVHGEA